MKSKCFIIKSILKECCLIIPSTNLIAVTLEMGFAVRFFFQVSIPNFLYRRISKWQSFFFIFYFLSFYKFEREVQWSGSYGQEFSNACPRNHCQGVPKSSANSATICASLINRFGRSCHKYEALEAWWLQLGLDWIFMGEDWGGRCTQITFRTTMPPFLLKEKIYTFLLFRRKYYNTCKVNFQEHTYSCEYSTSGWWGWAFKSTERFLNLKLVQIYIIYYLIFIK